MNSFADTVAGMERVTLIASLVSCVVWHSASANLLVTPRDTESKVNDSTYFNCSTDILSKEIHWNHGSNYVYGGGSFYEPYLGRFRIEINNSTGLYNLVIPSVEPQDAGEYTCQDNGGHGRHSPAAKLVVLADEPTCHSNSFQDGNSCELQPHEVQLSCSVAYHGNIPPKLEWRKAGENSLIEKVTSVVSGNSTTYSITLKADLSMNSQSYVCQTTRSVTSQYKCNSETIRLQYVFSGNARVNITMDEEVTCSANSSQSCSYIWKWFSGSDSLTVSTDQTLKATKVGSHRCEATCPIGNTSCMVVVMFAEVYSTEATSNGKMWLLLLLLLVIVLITIVVVVLCRRHKRANKKPLTSQLEANVTEQELPTVPLIAEHKDQVKQSGAKPNNGPKEEVETNKTDDATTPLIALKAKDKEHEKHSLAGPDKEVGAIKTDQPNAHLTAEDKIEIKQNHAELNNGRKEEVETVKTDQPKAPLTAEGKEEVKQTDKADPNKSPKELSLLEGKPEYVSTMKQEKNKEKRIIGVTVLKNDLLVASENSSALEVYDAIHKYVWRARVPIPEMVNPFDLTCCHITECVFISDSKRETKPKEIIRIESSMTVGKRWWTGDDFGNMSVSSDSNVILCVTDKNVLIEYASDGKKIRVINLSDIVHPRHAIKLTNSQFVVSHGCKNDTLHRVCNVSSDGKIMMSFGGEKGTSLELLNEPNSLIVDEGGTVLVLDSSNKRVLLLDSSLKVKREYLTKQTGLLNPRKMCLFEATRSLFVIDSVYEVLIFSIK